VNRTSCSLRHIYGVRRAQIILSTVVFWSSWQARSLTALVTEAVGLCSRTPIATVQVLCASPRAEDSEAGHLLELVRLQAVTRKEAKEATKGESPLVDKTAEGLLDLIVQSQGTDPLCIRLQKELSTNSGREGYSLGQEGQG
jgi:hypothetical protein